MANLTQTGPSSWRVLVRRVGQKAISRTFRDKDEALAYKLSVEAEVADSAKGEDVTLAACIAAFRRLREKRRPIKPVSTEATLLRQLEDGLGKKRINQLTPQAIASWCEERAEDGAGPSTVSMNISKLGTVLKHASLWLHVVLPDVVGAARPLLVYQGLIGPTNKRERRPSNEELIALMDVITLRMRDVVRIAIATGMRRSEIARITWDDLDHKRRVVLVRDRKHPRAKIGNHKEVPLVDWTGYDAYEIIARQPRVSERIFPLNVQSMSSEFAAACEAVSIQNLRLHDMRHECASRCFEAGRGIEEVARVTGHSKWEDLKRYTNIRHDPDRPKPACP